MRLKDKVAIITGAGSEVGIGAAIALAFSREGASITLADIDDAGCQRTADRIGDQGGDAISIRTDISSARDVEALVKATVNHFGAIHILVNNAAHMRDCAAVLETTEEGWTRSIDVTLKGAFLCSKFVIPEMIKAGGGSIINISSVGGLVGFENYAAYCAAKGGVIQLTKSLAIDYGRFKIRANAICPGPIQTGIAPQKGSKHWRYQVEMTVLGRTGNPEEVARPALFLASDESSYVTGTNLIVDGGWTLR